MKKADLVSCGRIQRSQGKEGKLKIRLREKTLLESAFTRVFLEKNDRLVEYTVESLEVDRNSYFLKLEGIETLVQADELAGHEIFLREECFKPPEEGRFYDFQVLGSRVVTKDGREVGTVKGILPVAEISLLVVSKGPQEIYVPFTDSICLRVDPGKREILIDPPEGLLELNEI